MADLELSPCAVKVRDHYKIDDETAKILDDVTEEYLQGGGDRNEMNKAKNYLAQAIKTEANIKLHAAIDSIAKTKAAVGRLRNPKIAADISQGLMSLVEKSTSIANSFGISLDKLKEINEIKYHGILATHLRKLKFVDEFDSGHFDKAIIDYVEFGKEYTGAHADTVKAVAKSLQDAYNIILNDSRANGILISEKKGYLGPVIHDRELVSLTPKHIWVADIANGLNLKKQFPLIPEGHIKQFERMLSEGLTPEMFEKEALGKKNTNPLVRIFSESHNSISGVDSDELIDFGRESIVTRRTAPRKFTEWKDSESIQGYLNKYSRYKTLAERYNHYANRASIDTAKVSIFGANPRMAIEEILKEYENMEMAKGTQRSVIKDNIDKFNTQYALLTESQYYKATKLGEAFKTLRELTTTSKLGKSAQTSLILDTLSSTMQRNITWNSSLIPSFVGAVSDRLMAAFKTGDPHLEQKYLIYKNNFTAAMSELNSNSKENNIINMSRKINAFVSFSDWMNRTAHIGAMRANLELLVKSDFKNLHPRTKAILDKFGITKTDIDTLKNFNVEEFGMMDVNNATVEDFKKIYPNYTAIQAATALNEFKNKINSFMIEETLDAAKRPDAWTRRVLYGKTKAGTGEGEARRIAAQLKTTAFTAGRDFFVGNARKVNFNKPQAGDVMIGSKNLAWYYGKYIGASLAAGLTLLYLNAASETNEKKRKEQLKRFEKKDPTLILDAAARSGLGFFFTDALAQNNEAKRLSYIIGGPMLSFLTGPLIDIAQTPFEKGNMGKKIGKQTVKAARSLAPASNQILIKDIWDGIEAEFKDTSSGRGSFTID